MNSVTKVRPDNGEPVGFGVFFNDLSNVSIVSSRLTCKREWFRRIKKFLKGEDKLTNLNRLFQTFSRHVNKPAANLVDCPHKVGFVEICVVAFEIYAHVNVDDVAVLKWPQVRNSVADHLVHRPSCRKARFSEFS